MAVLTAATVLCQTDLSCAGERTCLYTSMHSENGPADVLPALVCCAQLIRVCNSIHKRLGKHDVIHRARLLMLIANCTPLFDRSGVNVQVRAQAGQLGAVRAPTRVHNCSEGAAQGHAESICWHLKQAPVMCWHASVVCLLPHVCEQTCARAVFGCAVQAAFAPADPPPVEEVPADAVDSAGKPVDSTLYTAFWRLQV
jgi:hypothetical protein